MFDWSLLDSDFADRVRQVLSSLQIKGVIMIPYFGIRTPIQQAKLWCKSRDIQTITNEITKLQEQGCNYLVEILKDVNPENGEKVTDSLPGLSWHNWGMALDCYWEKDGAPSWDGSGEGYHAYADEAVSCGLTAGMNFVSFKDPGHIQLHSKEIPNLYTLVQVDQAMKEKFGSSLT